MTKRDEGSFEEVRDSEGHLLCKVDRKRNLLEIAKRRVRHLVDLTNLRSWRGEDDCEDKD